MKELLKAPINFIKSTIKDFKDKYVTKEIFNTLSKKFIKVYWEDKARILYYDDEGKKVIYGMLMPNGDITHNVKTVFRNRTLPEKTRYPWD